MSPRKRRGRRNSGLLHKERKMSREDDFFGDFEESSNDIDTGQEDTSEPLMDESPDEPEAVPVFEEPPRPASRSPRPRPKAKKKATKPKPKAAKKKTAKKPAKPAKKTRKPAPKKKKKAPAAKKKKAGKPKPKK